MAETWRKAIPMDVGGARRRITGATEAAERIERVKLRQESMRFGKENELLRLDLEEAIILDFLFFLFACLNEFVGFLRFLVLRSLCVI